MTRIPLILIPLLLAGCSESAAEQSADDAPTARELEAALKADTGPKLSPPDRDVLAEKLAAACPSAKPVNEAQCLSQGMGSHDFKCEYSLGDDEYLRHEGILSEVDGEYVLLEPETVCAQGA